MSHPNHLDTICDTGIKRLDLVIPVSYDHDDRLQGYIDSVGRKGNRSNFP